MVFPVPNTQFVEVKSKHIVGQIFGQLHDSFQVNCFDTFEAVSGASTLIIFGGFYLHIFRKHYFKVSFIQND